MSVLSQMLSSTALLITILPISMPVAGIISITVMAFYVIFGGVWGAGLSFGVSTIVTNDIIGKLTHKLDSPKRKLIATRMGIIIVLAACAAIATTIPSAIINDFGYLSMGLRGAVVLVPLSAALFFRGRVRSKWATAAILAGPIAVIAGNMADLTFDPLFIGIFAALLLCIIGGLRGSRKRFKQPN